MKLRKERGNGAEHMTLVRAGLDEDFILGCVLGLADMMEFDCVGGFWAPEEVKAPEEDSDGVLQP